MLCFHKCLVSRTLYRSKWILLAISMLNISTHAEKVCIRRSIVSLAHIERLYLPLYCTMIGSVPPVNRPPHSFPAAGALPFEDIFAILLRNSDFNCRVVV